MNFYETMFYLMCGIALIGWGIALYFAKQSDDYFKKLVQSEGEYTKLRMTVYSLDDELVQARKHIAELQKPKKRVKKVAVTSSNQNKED